MFRRDTKALDQEGLHAKLTVINAITRGEWFYALSADERTDITKAAQYAADNFDKSPDKLATSIENILASSTLTNPALVARDIADKTAGHYQFGTLKAQGYQEWQWQTVNDDAVCDICDPMDGEVFDIDLEFEPAHINCRCFAKPYGDPDEIELEPLYLIPRISPSPITEKRARRKIVEFWTLSSSAVNSIRQGSNDRSPYTQYRGVIVDAIKREPPTKKPLYRGMAMSEKEAKAFDAQMKGTVDLDISSWTPDRSTADDFSNNRWGTSENQKQDFPEASVLLILKPKAQAFRITDMAPDDQQFIDEHITGGQFKVISAEYDAQYVTYTIEMTGVLDK